MTVEISIIDKPEQRIVNPLVSILVLTYNRLTLSENCIPAMLDKIGQINAEILIWDNGSTDGTYDWLEEYSKADCRITKVFGSDKNIGIEAINNLAEEAKGKYILKVDDDLELPKNFAKRIVCAYDEADKEKLVFLSWDMRWGSEKTFATRSGKGLYKNKLGEIVNLSNGDRIFIHYTPSMWMANGAVRLSPRDKFFEIGGHPKGIRYGVDHRVSVAAEKHGYWIGFLHSPDLVTHLGFHESEAYRKFKDKELDKYGNPKHV